MQRRSATCYRSRLSQLAKPENVNVTLERSRGPARTPRGETQMNEPNLPHAKVTCNSGDPLRAAQLHNFALRLDLRRLRSDLAGPQQIVAVNRLLDATDAFGRALQWLRGRPIAADGGLEELERLAMELGVVADAVEAVAQ